MAKLIQSNIEAALEYIDKKKQIEQEAFINQRIDECFELLTKLGFALEREEVEYKIDPIIACQVTLDDNTIIQVFNTGVTGDIVVERLYRPSEYGVFTRIGAISFIKGSLVLTKSLSQLLDDGYIGTLMEARKIMVENLYPQKKDK